VICGTRGVPDTVAPFRAWRGSRDLVAQSPKFHASAVPEMPDRTKNVSTFTWRRNARPVQRLDFARSKPIAAVSNPPTREANRDGGDDRPPKRQRQIGDEPADREHQPEHFALHVPILTTRIAGEIIRTSFVAEIQPPATAQAYNEQDTHVGRVPLIFKCVSAAPPAVCA
jgi:hypothetical protein